MVNHSIFKFKVPEERIEKARKKIGNMYEGHRVDYDFWYYLLQRKFLEYVFEEREIITKKDFHVLFYIWAAVRVNLPLETKKRNIRRNLELKNKENREEFLELVDERLEGWFGFGMQNYNRFLNKKILSDLTEIYKALLNKEKSSDEIFDKIEKFAEKGYIGLQSAVLSPVFFALRPEEFPVVNNLIYKYNDKEGGFRKWIDDSYDNNFTNLTNYKEISNKMINFRDTLGLPKDLGYLDFILGAWSKDLPEWVKILDGYNYPSSKDNEEDKYMLNKIEEYMSHNPNLILYGPPGTGKTYWVRKYVEGAWKKIYESKPKWLIKKDIESEIIELFKDMTWYDAISVALYINGNLDKEKTIGPKEISELEIMKIYSSIKNSEDVRSTVRRTLLDHCSRDCKHITAEREGEEYFASEGRGQWILSDNGKNYVKENFSKIINSIKGKLDELKKDIKNKKDLIKPEITKENIIKFITFHQSFSYEEFFEGLTARTSEETGEIEYKVEEGVFKRFCFSALNSLFDYIGIDKEWIDSLPSLSDEEKGKIKQALKNDDCPRYYLIIDEINRGNISKIFGELITLLEKDKRLGMENEMTITLPYSGKRFGVPPNLYVIGTMNSTDRSIALIDAALRRRFAFMELEPEKELVPENIGGIPLRDIFVRMNEKIEVLKDRDHRIGHSYLMDKDDRPLKTVEDLQMRWFAEIIPLLQEYFYNEWEKMKEILGDGSLKDGFIVGEEKDREFFDNRELTDTIDKIIVWRIKWELMREDNVEKFKEAMLSIVKGGDEGDKSSSEEEGGEDKEH